MAGGAVMAYVAVGAARERSWKSKLFEPLYDQVDVDIRSAPTVAEPRPMAPAPVTQPAIAAQSTVSSNMATSAPITTQTTLPTFGTSRTAYNTSSTAYPYNAQQQQWPWGFGPTINIVSQPAQQADVAPTLPSDRSWLVMGAIGLALAVLLTR